MKFLHNPSFEFGQNFFCKLVGNTFWHLMTRLVSLFEPWDANGILMPVSAWPGHGHGRTRRRRPFLVAAGGLPSAPLMPHCFPSTSPNAPPSHASPSPPLGAVGRVTTRRPNRKPPRDPLACSRHCSPGPSILSSPRDFRRPAHPCRYPAGAPHATASTRWSPTRRSCLDTSPATHATQPVPIHSCVFYVVQLRPLLHRRHGGRRLPSATGQYTPPPHRNSPRRSHPRDAIKGTPRPPSTTTPPHSPPQPSSPPLAAPRKHRSPDDELTSAARPPAKFPTMKTPLPDSFHP